ncbi:FadR/GntR family transcriptional regulator [Sphingobium sp. HWE2-09]|uniref:FadR/GntR family transcriptional regulator n=1 Tax=Sphingobium sp. HWE2-09 TaxID=3108390 RepID=UPI002DCE44C0|nr:FCD domain-containing protein [Sphingobium sp. HWE2-09]
MADWLKKMTAVRSQPGAKRGRDELNSDIEKVKSYIRLARERGEARLPPERDFAEQIGLTRSQLRSVLRRLAEEGSIWRVVGSGTYFGMKPLVGGSASRTNDLAELTNPREVMEARLVLEPVLARFAATRARRENMDEIELCMERMRNSQHQSDWAFWDRRLHHAIGRAANSMLLLALLESVQMNMNRGIWGELNDQLHQKRSTATSMADHEAVVDNIRNRNPEGAFRAMESHLLRVQDTYFNS